MVTDIAWIGNALNVFGFLKPGQVRVFSLSEADQARAWITAAATPTS